MSATLARAVASFLRANQAQKITEYHDTAPLKTRIIVMTQVHLLSVMFTCWPAHDIVFKIHTLHVIFALASSALTSQVLIRLSGPLFHNFLEFLLSQPPQKNRRCCRLILYLCLCSYLFAGTPSIYLTQSKVSSDEKLGFSMASN